MVKEDILPEKNKAQPLISVIVPCYNQAQYLDECLQSVLEQTYQNWECIIVNDGSPDNTEEVVKKWTEKDPRFKYLKKENGGLSSARNAGIKAAQGEWILPLDADDKIGDRYLELAEKEFGESYTVIYCKAEKIGAQQGAWDLPTFSIEKLAATNIIFCSFFFTKNKFIAVGGYDENMKKGLEDWEFLIALLKSGGKVIQLDYLGFYYRIKESSMITNLDTKTKEAIFKYIERKHLDFFHQHLGSIHLLNHKSEQADLLRKTIESQQNKLSSRRYRLIDKLLSLIGK